MDTHHQIDKHSPIGVFDSGLGGLASLKALIEQFPNENTVFFGDTARVPYGDKPRDAIIEYAREDMRVLRFLEVKAVFIACNTADAIARETLESEFDLPMIGVVDPAAQEAVRLTKNKRIGVLGTAVTVTSGAYEAAVAALDPACTVFSQACPLLVPLIEAGHYRRGDAAVETVLRDYLLPLQAQNVDTVILGCTHYPLLYEIVEAILPGAAIVCSGAASMDLLRQKLAALDLLNDAPAAGVHRFYVSGAPEKFAANASVLLGTSALPQCERADPTAFSSAEAFPE